MRDLKTKVLAIERVLDEIRGMLNKGKPPRKITRKLSQVSKYLQELIDTGLKK